LLPFLPAFLYIVLLYLGLLSLPYTGFLSHISKIEFEEVFPEYADRSVLNEKENKEYIKILKKFNERKPFDLIQEKKQFKELQKNNVKLLKSKLPIEILNEVADIRVLVLNRATGPVKKRITDYCRKQNMLVERTLRDYQKYYEKEIKNCKSEFIQEFNFHDCKIVSYKEQGDNLIIKLDNSGGFTNIEQITFKNFNIIKEEKKLYGAWWLYDEIYKIKDKYEIHVLLQNRKEELIEFIISATNVEYKYEKEGKR